MKIRIFGAMGSGKTTLGKYLHTNLKIPLHTTDTFVFNAKGKRRDKQERKRLLEKKLGKSWIIEGVHHSWWIEKTHQEADIIIIMDKPFWLLTKRLIKRTFAEQKKPGTNRLTHCLKLLWMHFTQTYIEMKKYYTHARKSKGKTIIVTNQKNKEVVNEIQKYL